MAAYKRHPGGYRDCTLSDGTCSRLYVGTVDIMTGRWYPPSDGLGYWLEGEGGSPDVWVEPPLWPRREVREDGVWLAYRFGRALSGQGVI
jgi:hypothetical protein